MKRMDSRFKTRARIGAHCRDCGAYVPGQASGCDACGSANLSVLVRGDSVRVGVFGCTHERGVRDYLEPEEVAAVLGKWVPRG